VSGQVEQGQPPVMAMDLDLALRVLGDAAGVARESARSHEDHRALVASDEAALAALQALIDRARQYVAGPSSGRLAALCQVLQEPVPDRPEPVNVDTIVQAYLTDRGCMLISLAAAQSLGIAIR
jgi:hypothetical protein